MKKSFILATIVAMLAGTFISCDNQNKEQEPYNPDSLFAVISSHFDDDSLAMETDPYGTILSLMNKFITNQVNHDRMVADLVEMQVAMSGINDDITKFKDNALKSVKTDSIAQRINKVYDEVKKQYEKILPGKEAPALSFVNPEGKALNLAAFKGQILYVDVWATWCGPCKAEIPALEEVYKHFKGNDKIKVISISCDQDKEAWETFLKENPHEWAQYIVDENGDKALSEGYMVNTIPRFMVIDADGKFIDSNAKRPSDPEIISYLEGLLK